MTSSNNSSRKCPTGIAGLDEITSGGFPRDRATLICGGPGCGKTMVSITFLVHGVTRLDEPGIYVTFEQSRQDVLEDYAGIQLGLGGLVESGGITIVDLDLAASDVVESGPYNLDGLFAYLGAIIDRTGARRIVLDSIGALFARLGQHEFLRFELIRLLRWLREKGLTSVLTGGRGNNTLSRQGFEEYITDCVIYLDHRVCEQVTTRRLRIVKYRGSSHAHDEFPFIISDRGVTVMPITSLAIEHGVTDERISTGISSLIDTWIVLRDRTLDRTRRRTLQVVKSRGMAHAEDPRQLKFTGAGIRLLKQAPGPRDNQTHEGTGRE